MFNFQQIIDELNQNLPFASNFAYEIARAQVLPASYLFTSTILPQEERPDYHVNGGNLTIRPTMLGQVPMDTPYPPMGAISSSTFFENTTKLGGQMYFPEAHLRQLQSWANQMYANNIRSGVGIDVVQGMEKEKLVEAVIGFANMVRKAAWDTNEWLAGQSLSKGLINWKFGKMLLDVDYDIPAENKTSDVSTDAWFEANSKFWTRIRYVFKKLLNPRFIMNSNTYYAIADNEANHIEEIDIQGQNRRLKYFVPDVIRQPTDPRQSVTVTIYDKSADVLQPQAGNKDAILKPLQMLEDGVIIVVGEQTPDGYELLQGSVADPDNTLRLGYTHLAPTVEGGRMGIWSRVYTPEGKPYALQAEVAENVLPVILNPNRLMILKTAMPT